MLGLCLKLQNFCSEIINILVEKADFQIKKHLSVSLCLSNPSKRWIGQGWIMSAAICRHDPSQTLGITKVFFFKANPVHLLPRVHGWGSRQGGGNFLGPVLSVLRPSLLSPASLWRCHNRGQYNTGYCWWRSVTVDEALNGGSSLVVEAWLPDKCRHWTGRVVKEACT